MKIWTKLLGGFIAVTCLIGAYGLAKADWTELNDQIDQTNFLVNDNCSGTLIDKTVGLVLTASHCVARQYEIVPETDFGDDGQVNKTQRRVAVPGIVSQLNFLDSYSVQEVRYRTSPVGVDKDVDLALVKVVSKLPNTIETKIACDAPVRGEEVAAVGNPAGILYSSITVGIVSSHDRTFGLVNHPDRKRDAALMQISTGLIGGISGGAVYNTKGELVGVPVLGHRTHETYGFAVPLQTIHSFLRENGLGHMLKHCD